MKHGTYYTCDVCGKKIGTTHEPMNVSYGGGSGIDYTEHHHCNDHRTTNEESV